MMKRYDIAQTVILALLLAFAVAIGNVIIKGILLLLFSGLMIINIINILKKKREDKYIARVLYGLLLFLVSILALTSIYMIAATIIEAF